MRDETGKHSGSHGIVSGMLNCHLREIEVKIPHQPLFSFPVTRIIENAQQLGEIVVTGQFTPQNQNKVDSVSAMLNMSEQVGTPTLGYDDVKTDCLNQHNK